MKINITREDDGWWHLQLTEEAGVRYKSLLKLGMALVKYAKGQNL